MEELSMLGTRLDSACLDASCGGDAIASIRSRSIDSSSTSSPVMGSRSSKAGVYRPATRILSVQRASLSPSASPPPLFEALLLLVVVIGGLRLTILHCDFSLRQGAVEGSSVCDESVLVVATPKGQT